MERILPGIYEEIVSKRLGKKLQMAGDIEYHIEQLDPQEAVRYLADYVQKLLKLHLKDLAEKTDRDDENTTALVYLANSIIRMLKSEQGIDVQDEVEEPGNLLLQVSTRQNSTLALQRKIQDIRPITSITTPYLFTGSRKEPQVASELTKEIFSSDRIDFLVSFIRWTGLRIILPQLRRFTEHGGKLRIITTTYMGATEAKAIRELTQLANTEIKISYNVKETRLHAKAYIFYRNTGFSTAYIGSSNLSKAAISEGLEWNIKITEQMMPEIMKKILATFETYWHSDDFVKIEGTEAEMKELVKRLQQTKLSSFSDGMDAYSFDIHPYPFQQEILDELAAEREIRGHMKNLVVAATGTGKTAISAFDYRRLRKQRLPKSTKLLFIAHREEILQQSLAAYRQVLKDRSFGELCVGGASPTQTEHLFMSIQTFMSRKFWQDMSPDYYDMIVVDEFHHACAPSYQKLISYFHPTVFLGLTATPERMDGASVLSYFDNHIAAEIRLPDAIERRLLCPFHYFGVEDTEDLSQIHWVGTGSSGHYDIKDLNNVYAIDEYKAKRRANAIFRAVEEYTTDLSQVKGLGFCVSKIHAHFMAQYFNLAYADKGFQAMALDADSSEPERKSAQSKLEQGKISFIFVVDLYNEGVDIPSVNTVLFLRPTNSLTVFLQQLGRGLRLADGKDVLTVLDFISPANRNYDFVSKLRALFTRKDVSVKDEINAGFVHIPKGCYIHLEEKPQKVILENIRAQLRNRNFYLERLRELYSVTGQVPSLRVFLSSLGQSVREFYNGKITFTELLYEAGIINEVDSAQGEILQKALPRICLIDSVSWLQYLRKHIGNKSSAQGKLEQQYLRMWQYTVWQREYNKAGFSEPSDAWVSWHGQPWENEVKEALELVYESINLTTHPIRVPFVCALEVYATYTRDQIFAALGLKNPQAVREGVKYLKELDTDVFLVTLNKSNKEFSDTTRYEDYSISDYLFHWQSQSTTSVESPTGQRYVNQLKNGNHVLLFVREQKTFRSKALPYTFLGTVKYVEHKGSRPISIIYRLDHPIPARYLQTTDSSGVM